MKRTCVLALTFCSMLSSSLLALSPPWYAFQKEMKAAVGADPCVSVADLDTSKTLYVLQIQETCGVSDKAIGLATMLTRDVKFGNQHVSVLVQDKSGNTVSPVTFPKDTSGVIAFINKTFSGNPLYVDTVQGNRIYPVFMEFHKKVVQFFADNLADKYANKNKVAADAFHNLIDFKGFSSIRIGTTTTTQD